MSLNRKAVELIALSVPGEDQALTRNRQDFDADLNSECISVASVFLICLSLTMVERCSQQDGCFAFPSRLGLPDQSKHRGQIAWHMATPLTVRLKFLATH
jgi:hypothetical protein